ncbi:MAG: transcriptional repressor [Anaerolineales bacterium]|nr:transcriptional repressor [Anaerolineales bacterium]
MSCSKPFADKLQARGFRMTPQSHTILHILKQSGGHFSPAQVYEKARQSVPGMTEATVYRTLEFLAENNIVFPTLNGNGHLVYEIAGHDHHHLVCRACGQEVEIEHTRLQPLLADLEAATGFQSIGSHITFFGLCPECKRDSGLS